MKKLLAIALAVVLMAMSPGVAMAAVGGAWATKAVHPVGIEGAAASLINGKIYVSHGLRLSDSDNLTIYDIATDTWSSGADANVPRSELVGASAGGKHYAIGGRPAQSTVEIYDPATDTWSMGPAMPTARRGLGAATIGSKIYVVGGSTGTAPHSGTPLATNEVLDTVAGTWASLAPMSTNMTDVYATVAYGGKVYVFGGFDGTAVSNKVQIYDPGTDNWSFGSPMPTARSNALAGVACGKIFVIGGYNPALGGNLNINEVYNPVTDTWDTAPSKPTPGSEFAVGDVSFGGKIYAIGSGIFGAAENTHEVFSCALQIDKELEASREIEGDGDGVIEVGEKWEFDLLITVTNNDTVNAITGVMVKDNLGGYLELLAVNGEEVDQPTNKKDDWTDSTGNVSVLWTGKTLKAHLWWAVHTLNPGETDTLLLTVSTDLNPGQGKKTPPGQNEYTSTGIHELNSGATASGMLGDGEIAVETVPIWVNVEPFVDNS